MSLPQAVDCYKLLAVVAVSSSSTFLTHSSSAFSQNSTGLTDFLFAVLPKTF